MEAGLPFFSYTNTSDLGLSIGGQLGVGANAQLSENWYLSPSLYFLSIKSIKIPSLSLETGDPILDGYYQDASARLNMGATDLQLMLSYQPNNSNIRIGLSPQVSFARNANITYEGEYGSFKEDASDNINHIDYGAIANVGYFFRSANKGSGMIINLRYYQGFTDIFKNDFIDGDNIASYFSFHVSLPFITDELASKNFKLRKKKDKDIKE